MDENELLMLYFCFRLLYSYCCFTDTLKHRSWMRIRAVKGRRCRSSSSALSSTKYRLVSSIEF